MTPVERLLSRLPDTKPSGKGWSARCPAHDDRRASLSVTEGDDGRALVHCHAGCEVDAVCQAIDLSMFDLMPTDDTLFVNGVNVNKTTSCARNNKVSLTGNGKSAHKAFATANEAVAELERQHGPRSALWTYENASGDPVGVIVRWDLADSEKDIRPVSRHDDVWRIGGMPGPRPLYCLTALAGANRVYVCEGEKAAEAARSIGLVATTSAHGANSASKADWQPLAGKEIIILPDNDTAGQIYAEDVVGLLAKLTPAPMLKLVELPGLEPGGDLFDWIEDHGDAAEPDAMRQEIEGLAAAVEPITIEAHDDQDHEIAPAVDQYQPFPTEALPEPWRGFVDAGAKAIGCDAAYIALPMLSMFGAAIGNARRLRLKPGWDAPPILWTCIIGESGSAKTPAFKQALRPIRDRQTRAFERHDEAMRDYEADLARYEKELVASRRPATRIEDPPKKPEEPQAERYIVSDVTTESLAPILKSNPRGLLAARDELSGLFGSFDRYSGKGGADAPAWLSMHGAECVTVDRKTGTHRTIHIPMAAVSITGGIQPAILYRVLGQLHRDNGMAARFLFANPPRGVKRWSEAKLDRTIEEKLGRVFDRIYELQPEVTVGGEVFPIAISLTREAKAIWMDYFNSHSKELVDLHGDLAAAWSKLEEAAARIALVVHLVRWAAGDRSVEHDQVDAESMAAGISLAQWFKGEARRFYGTLGETDEDRDRRRLVEWIARKGGSVTARDVQMNCRWLKGSGEAEVALNDLVKNGLGYWQDVPTTSKGGRPSRRFALSMQSTVNKTPANPELNLGSVDVDTVDASEMHGESERLDYINAALFDATDDSEWGEL